MDKQVTTPMPTRILVSDTNIWIDLHRSGLLETVFRLPCLLMVLRAVNPNNDDLFWSGSDCFLIDFSPWPEWYRKPE